MWHEANVSKKKNSLSLDSKKKKYILLLSRNFQQSEVNINCGPEPLKF
jgi:hypothetical protein